MNNYGAPGLVYCLSQVCEAAFMWMVLRSLCWIRGDFKEKSDEIQHLSAFEDQHLYPIVLDLFAPIQWHSPRATRSTKRAGGVFVGELRCQSWSDFSV